MRTKTWIIASVLLLASGSSWAAYALARRAYLADFNAGVHAYLSGDFIGAELALGKALARRPHSNQVKQLLSKVLIDRSFAQYRGKDFTGALETLDRAALVVPSDEEGKQALEALRQQLMSSSSEHPVSFAKVLDHLYRTLPEKNQPQDLQAIMEQWSRRSQANQEAILKKFWNRQEDWLTQLQQEKDGFKKVLYSGIAFFSFSGVLMVMFLAGLLKAYFGNRGIVARLLDEHYQRLVTALPAGTQVLLGPPVSLHHAPEARQMDAIEAEISSGAEGNEDRMQKLKPLLEGENAWVRARAAKILYQWDSRAALKELRELVNDASGGGQVPGMWALGELATADALELLTPLAYSPIREVQQGAIRSLLQLQARPVLKPGVREKLELLLPEIRSKTGWVF